MRRYHDLPAPVTVHEEPVAAGELQKKQRGKYQHFSPKEKATIGRYASEHGVANAVKHFKEKVLKESTVRDWRNLYRKELSDTAKKVKPGEKAQVTELFSKKHLFWERN